jgi:hypothetical protein
VIIEIIVVLPAPVRAQQPVRLARVDVEPHPVDGDKVAEAAPKAPHSSIRMSVIATPSSLVAIRNNARLPTTSFQRPEGNRPYRQGPSPSPAAQMRHLV